MKTISTGFIIVLWLFLISCTENISQNTSADYDTTQWPSSFGFGKEALDEKIHLLDIDVRPDGKGLPQGSGTFDNGKVLYKEKCSVCHGATGTEGPYNKLVSKASLDDSRAEKTIGNYWPYASTVFDYIYRAMPFDKPGSLTAEETYSITAFLLARNNLIDSTLVLDATNLPLVVMPAKERFVNDDRKGGTEVR